MSLARMLRGDQAGDLLEDSVADPVAVGVVDRLEAVDVHERDRQRLGMAVRPFHLAAQGPKERLAVRIPVSRSRVACASATANVPAARLNARARRRSAARRTP